MRVPVWQSNPDNRRTMAHNKDRLFGSSLFLVAIVYSSLIAVIVTSYRPPFTTDNLAFWALPQAFTLGILLVLKPPAALLGGVTLAFGTLPLVCYAWPDFPLGSMGYLACTAGACIGGSIAAIKAIIQAPMRPAAAAINGFVFVLSGILINIALLSCLRFL